MIIQPTITAPTIGSTVGQLRWTLPDNMPGTAIGARPVNNTRSTSFSYQGMNNLVKTLDSLFHTLPPTGPASQAAWNAAVPDYAGVRVCGCGDTAINAQKLFRLVNFFLTVTGLPIDNTPPPTGTPLPAILDDFLIFRSPPALIPEILLDWSSYVPVTTLLIQLGQGLTNPILPGAAMILTPADANFATYYSFTTGDIIPWCAFDSLGQPNNTGTATVTEYP